MMHVRESSQMPASSGRASRVLVPPLRQGDPWQERKPGTRAASTDRDRLASKCACGGSCPKCYNPTGELGTGPEPTTADAGVDAGTAASDAGAAVGDAGTAAVDGGVTAAGAGGAVPPAAPVVTPARSARLKSGPRYTPRGNVAPTLAGGVKNLPFVFDAEFDSDPANGVFPACGEIHQDIKWDTAARTNGNAQWGLNTPHGGFPATHPANTWIEDRDQPNASRYGRRRGPFSAPSGGDEYTNAGGVRNTASGPIYHGVDNPSNVPAAFHGRWTFMVLAFDMCNRGTQVGSADFIIIDW